MLVTNTNPFPIDYSLNSLPIIPWGALTDDALETIFKELDRENLRNVAFVSREWYVISSSDAVWRQHVNSSMQAPHLKYQLKCQIGFAKIDSVIQENLPITKPYKYLPKLNSKDPACDSFCKLIDVLFKGNILTITNSFLYRFDLILNKTRQLNFNDKNITYIVIPKKVYFFVHSTNEDHEQYLDFKCERTDLENSIKINSFPWEDPTLLCRIDWIKQHSTFQFVCINGQFTRINTCVKTHISPEILFNPSSIQDC